MVDTPSSIIAQLSFFAQPPLSEQPLSLCGLPLLTFCIHLADDWFSWTLTKMSIIFFLFFLLDMSEFSTYVRELVTPTSQGFPPPFFLGVAIGLELRIRL